MEGRGMDKTNILGQRWEEAVALVDSELTGCVMRLPPACPERLREAIGYSLLAPGKRLRPLLCLLANQALGGTLEKAIPAACAVEMIHCYSLIHDDLPAMDDDDLRRGRPTCHIRFDEATAILAGDALIAMAFEELAHRFEPPSARGKAVLALARAAGPAALVGGQMDDLWAEKNGGDKVLLAAIHTRKTGAMITVSLELGGLSAGAGSEQLDRLRQYGEHIGLAFQIVDDLLDEQSSDQQMGKRTGKDRDRGKLTYPGLYGLEASRREARRQIDGAIAAIGAFGPEAIPLRQLATFVLERSH